MMKIKWERIAAGSYEHKGTTIERCARFRNWELRQEGRVVFHKTLSAAKVDAAAWWMGACEREEERVNAEVERKAHVAAVKAEREEANAIAEEKKRAAAQSLDALKAKLEAAGEVVMEALTDGAKLSALLNRSDRLGVQGLVKWYKRRSAWIIFIIKVDARGLPVISRANPARREREFWGISEQYRSMTAPLPVDGDFADALAAAIEYAALAARSSIRAGAPAQQEGGLGLEPTGIAILAGISIGDEAEEAKRVEVAEEAARVAAVDAVAKSDELLPPDEKRLPGVSLVERDGELRLTSPYCAEAIPSLRVLGNWDPCTREWVFGLDHGEAVEGICFQVWGHAGDPVQVLDLRVECDGFDGDQEIVIAGRVIARRKGRDWRVQLGVGVEVIGGGFPSRGGSRANPRLCGDAVLIVHDVPRALALAAAEEDCDVTTLPGALDAEVIAARYPRPTEENALDLWEAATRGDRDAALVLWRLANRGAVERLGGSS